MSIEVIKWNPKKYSMNLRVGRKKRGKKPKKSWTNRKQLVRR